MQSTVSVETPLGSVKVSSKSSGDHELRVGLLPRDLANGMSLDTRSVVVCQLAPAEIPSSLVLRAECESGACTGAPDSGEGLEALTFSNNDCVLSIGTEDPEALQGRFPGSAFQGVPEVIYEPAAIELRVKSVSAGVPASFHIAVACKKLPDPDDCATWYAVDVSNEAANKSLNTDREDAAGLLSVRE